MKNTMTKVSKITGMAAALAAISMVFTGCASIEGTATITPEGASTGTVVNYSADVAGEGEQAVSKQVQTQAAPVQQAEVKAAEANKEAAPVKTETNTAENKTEQAAPVQNNIQNTAAQNDTNNTTAQQTNTQNTTSLAETKSTSSQAESKTVDTNSDSSANETSFVGTDANMGWEMFDLNSYDPITLAGFRYDDMAQKSAYHITDTVYGVQGMCFGVVYDSVPNISLVSQPVFAEDGEAHSSIVADHNGSSYVLGERARLINCFGNTFIGLADATGKEVYASMSYNELKEAFGGELYVYRANDTLNYCVGGDVNGRHWRFGLDLTETQKAEINARIEAQLPTDEMLHNNALMSGEYSVDISDMDPYTFVAVIDLGR